MLTSGDLTPKICFKISPQQEFTFYGRDGQVVGTMNFSRTPTFEGSLDESAHLFFNGVANLWHNEISDLRAKLQAAEEREARLREALEEIIEDANCECFYATPNPKLIVCPPCIARAALEVKK